jgi:hypothetical protein
MPAGMTAPHGSRRLCHWAPGQLRVSNNLTRRFPITSNTVLS